MGHHILGANHAPIVVHHLSLTRGIDDHTATAIHATDVIDALREATRVRGQLLSAVIALSNKVDNMEALRTGIPKKNARKSVMATRVPTIEDIAVATSVQSMLLPHAKALRADCTALERHIRKLAQQLPVWPWTKGVRGFGALGLGLIVGTCGDLLNYANPPKLWKRLGLGVIDGERQRRITDPEMAARHGYSPRRRAIVWAIGDSLLKGNRDGEYRQVYLARKEQYGCRASGVDRQASACRCRALHAKAFDPQPLARMASGGDHTKRDTRWRNVFT